jgi:sugar transferase (PEP-CTERM/EpsH1 system associated)
VNVLFISHRLPYAPNRGDRVRAFHLLREISRWANVDVISLAHDAHEAEQASTLRDTARSVTTIRVPGIPNFLRAAASLPSSTPTTHSLLAAPELGARIDSIASSHPPDVVFAYCTGIAPAAFRPSVADRPLILDMVDVDSKKWAAMAQSARPPMSWIYRREARVLGVFEAFAARKAANTLVVNERERQDLLALAPDVRVQVVENGVDLSAFHPQGGPAANQDVVFCGVMNYAPNVEGALWLGREVWPLVRARVPGARLKIVGASPARSVHALADEAGGITIAGSVPDVRPHLWSAAVAVAPLQTARGVQNKVLEGVAAGLPVVVTPVVMEGLPHEVRPACAEAATPAAFADRIAAWLMISPEARRALATTAPLDALAWDRRLAGLEQLFRNAAGTY